jgi:hypothetical protein
VKLSRRDLVLLKMPLLGALAAFAIAALMTWWSLLHSTEARLAHDAASRHKQQSEQRLLQIERDAPEHEKLAAQFSNLQQSRHFIRENRLEWTETLAQIGHDMQLIDLHYEFAPQTLISTDKNAAYQTFSSLMTLQLRPRHEQALLDFLAQLQRQATAMILVRHCRLSAEGQPERAGLAATCELAWVTSSPPLASQ